jgi:AraC-like DNA-binding protein
VEELAWQTVAEVLRRMQADLDSAWTLERAAALSGYEHHHFAHLFREVVGEPPVSYHRRLRMERAAYHLARTALPLPEVASLAGYGSAEAFTRAFRRQLGCSPSRFRRDALLYEERSSPRPAPLGGGGLAPPEGLSARPEIARLGPLHCWSVQVPTMAMEHVGVGMAALLGAAPPDGPWQLGGLAQPWGWHTSSADKEFRCLRLVPWDAPPPPPPLLPWRMAPRWFAIFTFEGALEGVDPACRWMAERWAPASGLRLAYGPLLSLLEGLVPGGPIRARLHLAVSPLHATG